MKNKKTKVLVFGSSGLLGGEIFNYFFSKGFSVSGYNSKSCDITKFDQVLKIIKKIKPDIVINCAGKIGINECENDPLGAYSANSIGPGNIARALKLLKREAVFLHISSSYASGGKPADVYGLSKSFGEKIIEQELKNSSLVKYYIIITGWLYGRFRRTFVEEIADSLLSDRTIKLIFDNYAVPTWTKDLAKGAVVLLKNKKLKSGIYHLSNSYEKPVSKYDIGVFIAGILGKRSDGLRPCRHKDIFKISRRQNTEPATSKNIKLPHWKKSLADYLKSK